MLPLFPSLQAKAPALGDPAPTLRFDRLLGGKERDDFAPNRLMGKVTVVEFSASWCGPCRASVPHLNALAEELKGLPIRFVAVTAESEAVSRKFRDETRLAFPMGVSADGSVFESYWIGSLPTVVVIGRDGRIQARMHPSELKPEALRALAAGRPVSFPSGAPPARRTWNPAGFAEKTSGTWLKTVDVRAMRATLGQEPGVITTDGVPEGTLLYLAFQVSPTEIEIDRPEKGKYYSGRFEAADKTLSSARKIMQGLIAERLGWRAEPAKRTGEAWVLRLRPGAKPAPPTAPNDLQDTWMLGTIDAPRLEARDLVLALRGFVELPVVDATGLASPFSIKVKWDPTKGDSVLVESLAGAGFTLTKERTEFPYLKVTKGPPNQKLAQHARTVDLQLLRSGQRTKGLAR